MEEELDKIKNHLLDEFIKVLEERGSSKFDDIFSYDDIYKIVSGTYCKNE